MRRDLRHWISNTGESVEEDEVEDMLKEADKDGDGFIEYNEFASVLLAETAIEPKLVVSAELAPYYKPPKE